MNELKFFKYLDSNVTNLIPHINIKYDYFTIKILSVFNISLGLTSI
jgi:hypothetical protein